IDGDTLAGHLHCLDVGARHDESGGRSVEADFLPGFSYARAKRIGKCGKAPFVIGEDLAPVVASRSASQRDLLPEPHGRNLVGIRSKLAYHERLPDDAVNLLTAGLD